MLKNVIINNKNIKFNNFSKKLNLISNIFQKFKDLLLNLNIKFNFSDNNNIKNDFFLFNKELNLFSKSFDDEIIYPFENIYNNIINLENENNKKKENLFNNILNQKKNLNKKFILFKKKNKKKKKIQITKNDLINEINLINNSIENSKIKFNEINNNNNLNIKSNIIIIKDLLNKFTNKIKNISNIINNLSNNLQNDFLNYDFNNNENNENFNEIFEKVFFIENNENLNEINENLNEKNNENLNENEKLIENFINNLLLKEDISIYLLTEIIHFIKNDSKKAIFFLNKLLNFNKGKKIFFINNENLTNLSKILNIILKDYKNENNNNIIINDLILKISNIIFYEEFNLFNYLTNLNFFYKSEEFWIEIIEKKINENINKFINSNLLLNNENEENFILNNNNLIEYLNNNKTIENFNKLNNYKKFLLENFINKNFFLFEKDYFFYMLNFNIKNLLIKKILLKIDKKFGLNNNNNKIFYSILNIKNLEKNKKVFKYYNSNISKIISKCSKFLTKKEEFNLKLLNKEINKKIIKKNMKNYFKNIFPLNKFINLWKIVLNFNSIKKQFNYKEILQKINENNIKIPDFEIIKNDVLRTQFLEDTKNRQKILLNNLKCISYLSEKGYYQGMSFINSFFLQLLNFDEESSFIFMLCLIKNTDFFKIFNKKMKNLAIIFEITTKLLKIYYPKIINIIINNNIDLQMFSSGIFLTLFTNIKIFFDNENYSYFSFYIIQNFFIEGWCAIIRALISLLIFHEEKIIILSENKDKLIDFLVNNILIDESLTNENFFKFQKIFEENRKKINNFIFNEMFDVIKYEKKNKFN